jgi:hypothetical protein
MRPFSTAFVALCCTLLCDQAAAADADVLRQFGMLGRLAVDCKAPYSRTNPHLIFVASPKGKVTRTLNRARDRDGTFPMRNLRLLAPDRLQYQEISRGFEKTMTVARIDGKFRFWSSVQSDGAVLIADGKLSNTGAATFTFQKCAG